MTVATTLTVNSNRSASAATFHEESRGGGPGRKGSKAQNSLEDHRKRKLDQIDELKTILKDKHETHRSWALNHTRKMAFDMARAGYEANKDEDDEQAAFYRDKTKAILEGTTSADGTE